MIRPLAALAAILCGSLSPHPIVPCLDAASRSALAEKPDWSRLDAYQETVTRERFLRELDGVYAPRGAWRPYIRVGEAHAEILMESGGADRWFRLRFAPDASRAGDPPRYWSPTGARAGAGAALRGMHIAIDPGHIGGKFARIEERWFQIGDQRPVMEGEMTLDVAKMIRERLESHGARVSLVRERNEPVTRSRPEDFRGEAVAELRRLGRPVGGDGARDAFRIRKQSEMLFYRAAEIRARAERVNGRLRPDLVLALHFNAEAWGDPADPRLTSKNHFHVLINGAYSRGEVGLDDNRFFLVLRILQGIHAEELRVADAMARAMAEANGLPPYVYAGGNAIRVNANPYVYARNLLANRIYLCPVVYLEPYVMNSREVHERIQAGDYEGARQVAGRQRPSLYREYADSVVDGLLRHVTGRGPR